MSFESFLLQQGLPPEMASRGNTEAMNATKSVSPASHYLPTDLAAYAVGGSAAAGPSTPLPEGPGAAASGSSAYRTHTDYVEALLAEHAARRQTRAQGAGQLKHSTSASAILTSDPHHQNVAAGGPQSQNYVGEPGSEDGYKRAGNVSVPAPRASPKRRGPKSEASSPTAGNRSARSNQSGAEPGSPSFSADDNSQYNSEGEGSPNGDLSRSPYEPKFSRQEQLEGFSTQPLPSEVAAANSTVSASRQVQGIKQHDVMELSAKASSTVNRGSPPAQRQLQQRQRARARSTMKPRSTSNRSSPTGKPRSHSQSRKSKVGSDLMRSPHSQRLSAVLDKFSDPRAPGAKPTPNLPTDMVASMRALAMETTKERGTGGLRSGASSPKRSQPSSPKMTGRTPRLQPLRNAPKGVFSVPEGENMDEEPDLMETKNTAGARAVADAVLAKYAKLERMDQWGTDSNDRTFDMAPELQNRIATLDEGEMSTKKNFHSNYDEEGYAKQAPPSLQNTMNTPLRRESLLEGLVRDVDANEGPLPQPRNLADTLVALNFVENKDKDYARKLEAQMANANITIHHEEEVIPRWDVSDYIMDALGATGVDELVPRVEHTKESISKTSKPGAKGAKGAKAAASSSSPVAASPKHSRARKDHLVTYLEQNPQGGVVGERLALSLDAAKQVITASYEPGEDATISFTRVPHLPEQVQNAMVSKILAPPAFHPDLAQLLDGTAKTTSDAPGDIGALDQTPLLTPAPCQFAPATTRTSMYVIEGSKERVMSIAKDTRPLPQPTERRAYLLGGFRPMEAVQLDSEVEALVAPLLDRRTSTSTVMLEKNQQTDKPIAPWAPGGLATLGEAPAEWGAQGTAGAVVLNSALNSTLGSTLRSSGLPGPGEPGKAGEGTLTNPPRPGSHSRRQAPNPYDISPRGTPHKAAEEKVKEEEPKEQSVQDQMNALLNITNPSKGLSAEAESQVQILAKTLQEQQKVQQQQSEQIMQTLTLLQQQQAQAGVGGLPTSVAQQQQQQILKQIADMLGQAPPPPPPRPEFITARGTRYNGGEITPAGHTNRSDLSNTGLSRIRNRAEVVEMENQVDDQRRRNLVQQRSYATLGPSHDSVREHDLAVRKHKSGGIVDPAHVPKAIPHKTLNPDDVDRMGPVEEKKEIDGIITENQKKELFTRCRNNRYAQVEEMFAAGIPVDTADAHGNQCLHISCQNGNKRMAKICLRWGANIDGANRQGQTPLHFCCAYNYDKIAAYLISKGADDTVLNKFGYSCYDGLRPDNRNEAAALLREQLGELTDQMVNELLGAQ